MYVIKKDNTHEPWNVQKVVVAIDPKPGDLPMSRLKWG